MGVFSFVAYQYGRKPQTGFLDRRLIWNGSERAYQVFLPKEWNSKSGKWPLILFLHGAGERGTDGLLQTQVGLGAAIRNHRGRFPCIAVFPQCPLEHWWTDPEMRDFAMVALKQSAKEFKGDESRFYLTGISMGGYGTWAIAGDHPGVFAALAPICGGIRIPSVDGAKTMRTAFSDPEPYQQAVKRIGAVPAWVFHGDADELVPVEESRLLAKAMDRQYGLCRYTEYPGLGHNSWDQAYGEPEFINWLLMQKKPSKK